MAISPWACVTVMIKWRVSTVVMLRWCVHTHPSSMILTAIWTSASILRWWSWHRVEGWSLHIWWRRGWQDWLVKASSVSGRRGRRRGK